MAASCKADKLKGFISCIPRDSAAADALAYALQARLRRHHRPPRPALRRKVAGRTRRVHPPLRHGDPARQRGARVDLGELEPDESSSATSASSATVGETPRDAPPRQLGEIDILPVGASTPRSIWTPWCRCWKPTALAQGSLAPARPRGGAAGQGPRVSGAAAAGRRARGGGALEGCRPAKAPLPAQEVLDLLHAVAGAVTRRQRRGWTGGSITFAVFALGLAWFAERQCSARR